MAVRTKILISNIIEHIINKPPPLYSNIGGGFTHRIDDTEHNFILGYEEVLNEILRDLRNQVPKSIISSKFHNTVIEATAECVCRIRKETRLEDVVLSGGVFENTYLLDRLISRLQNMLGDSP